MTLTGVEFNQAAGIMVADNGATLPPSQRNARLLRNRHALVRAVYKLDAGWSPREIEGRLSLYHSSGEVEVLKDARMISEDSDLSTLGGTFEWRLEPEQMTADMAYSVGLFELSRAGNTNRGEPVRIPTEGSDALGVPDELMRFEVVVLKIEVGGQTAVFDDANLEALRRVLYQHYPVNELDVTLRDEAVSSGSCASDNGVTCLRTVEQIRSGDAPDPHVYYLGLGHEKSVGGVSNLASPTMGDASSRASFAWVGTGSWEGQVGTQIAGHELGHAQNSPHTPGCNAGGAVSDYPHKNGEGQSEIGVWGYEILSEVLHDKTNTFDIMCYCQPHWSSDYTYEKWARVISELSAWPQRYERDGHPAKLEILRGMVGPRGNSTWWIMYDTMPASATQIVQGSASVLTREGSRFELPVYQTEIADSDYVSLYARLPAQESELAEIVFRTQGDVFVLDDPSHWSGATGWRWRSAQ